MRHKQLPSAMCALLALGLCALGGLVATNSACGSDNPGNDAVGAKIVQIEGMAEVGMPGETARVSRAGDFINYGEDMVLHKGSTVTLAFSDRTLREFTGPATVSIRREAGPAGGTVLGNLAAAVADMLFSGKPRTSEAVMATRAVGAGIDARTSVPVLMNPAPGENLADPPKQFRWKAVDGVPLYRVSVYSTTQMMWQGTTSESEAICPGKTCDFTPGQVYYWVVEALVGNTTIRSQAADFSVLSAAERSALSKALDEVDSSGLDQAAAMALKARLCLDSGAYAKAASMLDQAIAGSPSRAAFTLRAEVNEARGLVEAALSDYREAMAFPPSE
jgi:hypothetical protein